MDSNRKLIFKKGINKIKYQVGSFTLSSNPSTFTFADSTFKADLIIFASAKASATGTDFSIGASDGINSRSISTLNDTSKKTEFSTKAILHYLNVSGVATKKLDATGVDLSVAGQCTFSTVANYDPTVPIMFIAIGE